MKFDILTIFPDIFNSYFNESIIKRAQKSKLININVHNVRDFGLGVRKTTDDTSYGGGPGMLMTIEPIYKTLKRIKKKKKSKVILFTPTGNKFDQNKAKEFIELDQLILICGHYEGIDSRIDNFIDEKISIGDFVVTSGVIPAMTIVDACTRLIPGVLGNEESFKQDSFYDENLLEYPQYTRPASFKYREGFKNKKLDVPDVLLSGNHKEINKWRKDHSKKSK